MGTYKKEGKRLEFVSPLCPSNNGYNEYRVIQKGLGKSGKSFVHPYPSKEYTQYKQNFIPYLKKMVRELEWEMVSEFKHYYLDIIIYFERTSCDPTNYFKCLQDVCNGILFVDDKIVLGRVQRVYYTHNPDCESRIECLLYPCEYAEVGIFNDMAEYQKFIDRCQTCKTYKDGACKMLEEYMSYIIPKEFDINTRECMKFREIQTKEPKIKKKDTT